MTRIPGGCEHKDGSGTAPSSPTVQGMTETRDRMERLGQLVAFLLDRERPVTRDEIAEVLPDYEGESGRHLFETDKAALRRAGIVIRTLEDDTGTTGYRLRRRDYELPPLELTDDERVALALAIHSVDFSAVPWARLIGTKLGATDTPPIAVLAELPGLELLPDLQDAAVRRCPVTFSYRGGQPRTVEPWGLVLKHGRWYLPAFCQRAGDRRVFRVDRIDPASVRIGEPGAFEVPAGVVPADLVPDDALTMGSGERRTARVRIDRRIAPLVRPAAGSPPPVEGDGTVVVEVEVGHEAAFVSWVLGWGELAVVEAPAELRDAVVARLRELAR